MALQLVYANEPLPKSWTSAIFLAGPTPRSDKATGIPTAESWRPLAIAYLESIGYDGVVFIPEDRHGIMRHSYDDQIAWEELCLNAADVIIFWVPRDLTLITLNPAKPDIQTLAMPAFTTNAEYGVWITRDPARVVFGAPPEAKKNDYLRYYGEEHHIPMCETLHATCDAALTKIGDVGNTERTGGERHIPLHIWRTASFKNWYKNLKTAGNRLESAKVEWVFRVGPEMQTVFFWILHVNVYITAEDRYKTNEIILGRPNISTIMLYEKADNILETRIVLVKEFRSPISDSGGYVYELTGGSSWEENIDPIQTAVEECHEEAGILLPQERFVEHDRRQLCATSLAHRAHLFSAELSREEMDAVASSSHVVRGVEADTERTWAQVWTYQRILEEKHVDWSMLGMIASVLHNI